MLSVLVICLVAALGTGLFLMFVTCGYETQRVIAICHAMTAVSSVLLTCYRLAYYNKSYDE
jgi:hypothetical protein